MTHYVLVLPLAAIGGALISANLAIIYLRLVHKRDLANKIADWFAPYVELFRLGGLGHDSGRHRKA